MTTPRAQPWVGVPDKATSDDHLVQLVERAAGAAARVADPNTQQAIGFILEMLVSLMRRSPQSPAGGVPTTPPSLATCSLTTGCLGPCGSTVREAFGGRMAEESSVRPAQPMLCRVRSADEVPPNSRDRGASAPGSATPPAPSQLAAFPPVAATPPAPKRDLVSRRRAGQAAVAQAGPPPHSLEPTPRGGGSLSSRQRPPAWTNPGWSRQLTDDESMPASGAPFSEVEVPARSRAITGVYPGRTNSHCGAATVGELASVASFHRTAARKGSGVAAASAPMTRQGVGNVSQKAREDTLRELRRLAEDGMAKAAAKAASTGEPAARRHVPKSASPSRGLVAATVGELPLWLRQDRRS